MKRLILAALALACAAPAQAQSVAGLPVFAPAGKIPATVIYCDNGAGLAQICTTGGGGGGGGTTATSTAAAPTYTEGSTTAPLSLNLSGDLRTLAKQNCSVVSADAVYTVGTYQPCTMTASGRIRIGMSSAGNVVPGAPPTSQTTADTVGCIYRSSSPTYANGNTGALGCDVSGNLLVGSTALGSPADTAWSGTGSGTMIQLLKAIATGAADTSASDVHLTAGNAAVGSITNTAFGISGTLPAFTTTPTVNLGTLNGAATAAKQPALGTAGAASSDVISVQGVAGGTPQPVSFADMGLITVTPAASSNAVMWSVDTTGYPTTVFQFTGTWVGGVNFEESNDATNWSSTNVSQATNTNGAGYNQTTTVFQGANQLVFVHPNNARYFRAKLSSYTSGTINATAFLRTSPVAPNTQTSIVGANATYVLGNIWRGYAPTDTTAALGANATFLSSARDIGNNLNGSNPSTTRAFSAFFYSDQASTTGSATGGAQILGSNDNTTYYPVVFGTLAAGVPLTLTTPAFFRYYKTRVYNGAVAETVLTVNIYYGE